MSKKKKETKPMELNFRPLTEVIEQRKNRPVYKTDIFLDELLRKEVDGDYERGVETGQVIELAGEFGTGKTQVCYTLMCIIDGEILFIDCEGTFRPQRLLEIAEKRGVNVDELAKRIHVVDAKETDEQIEAIKQAKQKVNPHLIIVDGLVTLFRGEFSGRGELASRQQKLNQFIHLLTRYVNENDAIAIVSNQVSSNPDLANPRYARPEERKPPTGGNIVGHGINNRIYLRKVAGSKTKRVAILIDSSYLPATEATFLISEKGIESTETKETETEE